MGIHVIDAATTRALLPIGTCVDLMASAMRALSSGQVALPPRAIHPLVDRRGFLGTMPGSCAEPRTFGIKVVSVMPGNAAAGRPVLQGSMLLFDAQSGAPTALIDGATLTAVRTAAVSGLATRLLARSDASALAILGYGVQAAEHLDAMCAVRDITRVAVWGRSPVRAVGFCKAHSKRLGIPVEYAADAEQACANAEIICTTTAAHTPVLHGAWVRPGTHVNLIGSHEPAAAEADTALIEKSSVYVDYLEFALRDAGEIVQAIDTGRITAAHLRGELGQLVAGSIGGRATAQEITVFKSLGIVVQDLVAASHVAHAARTQQRGVYCEF